MTWSVWFFALWSLFVIVPQLAWRVPIIITAIIVSLAPFFMPLILKKFLTFQIIENYYNTLPKVMTSEIILKLLTIIQYYVVLRYLVGPNLSFLDVFVYISVISIANAIPITVSGLGLRETASAWLLPKIGVPIEIAVGVPLLIFLFTAIIPAIPGIIFIFPSKRGED
jgi:uncharacterized membrane protein YbhN (UPF0104 family)